jgi:hypothetical protein
MFAPALTILAESWGRPCRSGALHGHGADVLTAGDRAVELAPDDGSLRESRGLARALTGDYLGAIEDFAFFVDWAREGNRSADIVSEREAWIAALQARRNPFDEATLERLRDS